MWFTVISSFNMVVSEVLFPHLSSVFAFIILKYVLGFTFTTLGPLAILIIR